MKIMYWGTAAAEGVPGVFCACETCRKARLTGGKNIRTRASAMVDDCLLIDFGPETYSNSLKYGFDLSKLENLLITHPHEDHFSPMELLNRMVGYSHNMASPALNIWCSRGVEACFYGFTRDNGAKMADDGRIAFHIMKPFETVRVGKHDVTPLVARHGPYGSYVYIVEADGKALLYYHDSGVFMPETAEYLSSCGKKLDLFSCDCTLGPYSGCSNGHSGGHCGLPDAVQLRDKLAGWGLMDGGTKLVVNHFSHNNPVNFEDLEPLAKKEGFDVSYDGMVVEL